GLARDVLMTNAVKPVTPDAFLQPARGTRIDISNRRQRGMEGRVEDGELRDLRSENPFGGFNAFHFQQVVLGREGRHAGDAVFNFGRRWRGLTKGFAAMSDPMPDGVDTLAIRLDLAFELGDGIVVGPLPLHLDGPKRLLGFRPREIEERYFEAAGTTVERQD